MATRWRGSPGVQAVCQVQQCGTGACVCTGWVWPRVPCACGQDRSSFSSLSFAASRNRALLDLHGSCATAFRAAVAIGHSSRLRGRPLASWPAPAMGTQCGERSYRKVPKKTKKKSFKQRDKFKKNWFFRESRLPYQKSIFDVSRPQIFENLVVRPLFRLYNL